MGESIPEGVEEEETESEGEDEGEDEEASEDEGGSEEASELSSSGLRPSPGIWGGSGGAPSALTPAALDVLGGGDDRVARWVTALGETESFAAAASSSDAGSSRLSRKNESSAPDGSSVDGSSVDPFESSRGRNTARNPTATLLPTKQLRRTRRRARRPRRVAPSRAAPLVRVPRAKGPPLKVPDDFDDFAARSRSAEAAAEAAVPRADRLRLHPEYVAATADEYARLARAHDWRTRSRASARNPARAGASRPASWPGCGRRVRRGRLHRRPRRGRILPRGGGDDENSNSGHSTTLGSRWTFSTLAVGAPRGVGVARAADDPGALRCAACRTFTPRWFLSFSKNRKKNRRRGATTAALPRPPLFSLRRNSTTSSGRTTRSRRFRSVAP